MKVSRNELKSILEVNLNALKQIERRKTLDKRIISKDGYYNFRLDKGQGELTQVAIEEYKSFWKNKAYVNAFNKL